MDKKHTLKLEQNFITLTGVVNVESICEKEAFILICDRKVRIVGVGVKVNKLNVDEGILQLQFEQLSQISYQNAKTEKFSIKNIFK